MTQPEETTAALIARLHEQLKIKEVQLENVRKSEAVHVDLAHKAYQERDASFAATSKAQDERDQARADLEASKAECLQWRKDIDIERAEVARLSRQLESTKNMLAERSGQSDGWFRACKQAEKERDEQIRGRAAFQQRCADSANKYTQERDEQRARAEKAEASLRAASASELKNFDIACQLGQRVEAAEHKVAMLEAEVANLKQGRDEADETIIRERKQVQELADRCPRKLHCRSIDIIRDRLETFAEQEAGRNKEAARLRKELDQARADFATVDRMLVERTRERDEARELLETMRWECKRAKESNDTRQSEMETTGKRAAAYRKERNEAREQLGHVLNATHRACKSLDRTSGEDVATAAERVAKELKEAREQLAKLEWKGKTGDGEVPTCLLCCGIEPGQSDIERLYPGQLGHKPTCWFALERNRKIAETVDPPREPVTHGKLLHPTHGEIKSHLVGHVGELLKSGRLVFGCDFGWPSVATFNVYRYACGADIGKKDATKSEPARPEPRRRLDRSAWREMRGLYESFLCRGAEIKPDPSPAASRPEPRFKVGEKVLFKDKVCTVSETTWHALFSCWTYQVDAGDAFLYPDVSKLKPAPKFAVGEWATHHAGDFEVRRSTWEKDCGWIYDIARLDLAWRARESDLTAQTPQHKHDCKGCVCVCVFLGRHSNRRGGEWDLWYQDAPGRELGFDCGYGLQWWSVDARGGAMDRTITEARRRAVARGLVKP